MYSTLLLALFYALLSMKRRKLSMNKTKDEAALSLFRLLFSFIVRYTTTLYSESLFRQNHYAEPPNMLTGHWPSFLRMSNSCTAFSGNPTFTSPLSCSFLLFLFTVSCYCCIFSRSLPLSDSPAFLLAASRSCCISSTVFTFRRAAPSYALVGIRLPAASLAFAAAIASPY